MHCTMAEGGEGDKERRQWVEETDRFLLRSYIQRLDKIIYKGDEPGFPELMLLSSFCRGWVSQCLESGALYLTIIRQMAAECEAGMAQFSRGQRGHWAGSGADSGAPVLISPCLLLHISPSGLRSWGASWPRVLKQWQWSAGQKNIWVQSLTGRKLAKKWWKIKQNASHQWGYGITESSPAGFQHIYLLLFFLAF